MIGNRTCLADIRRTADAATDPKQSMESRCHRLAAFNPARAGPAIVATLLLFALALKCFDLRAEVQFRSAEGKGGQQHWSALKNYATPSDTVYPRALADGTQVAVEEVQVFISGYITAEDVYGVKVMESLLKKGRQKIAGNVVSLAGNGGEVDAAMELGRLLRRLGVATIVARGNQCLSSCVFAFMGGDRRTVAGQIGIHRPYFSSTREIVDRRLYYRQLQKKLQQYIEELDFPPSLYEAVMVVPPQSVNMLSAADLKKYYLEGMSPSTEDEAFATEARELGISLLEYLQRKAQTQPCAGERGIFDACQGEARTAAASRPAADVATEQLEGRTTSATRAAGNVAGPEKADSERSSANSDAAGSPRAAF